MTTNTDLVNKWMELWLAFLCYSFAKLISNLANVENWGANCDTNQTKENAECLCLNCHNALSKWDTM